MYIQIPVEISWIAIERTQYIITHEWGKTNPVMALVQVHKLIHIFGATIGLVPHPTKSLEQWLSIENKASGAYGQRGDAESFMASANLNPLTGTPFYCG